MIVRKLSWNLRSLGRTIREICKVRIISLWVWGLRMTICWGILNKIVVIWRDIRLTLINCMESSKSFRLTSTSWKNNENLSPKRWPFGYSEHCSQQLNRATDLRKQRPGSSNKRDQAKTVRWDITAKKDHRTSVIDGHFVCWDRKLETSCDRKR